MNFSNYNSYCDFNYSDSSHLFHTLTYVEAMVTIVRRLLAPSLASHEYLPVGDDS